MNKNKKIKIGSDSIIEQWCDNEKASFAGIGETLGISKQAVKQRFNKEAEDIYLTQGINTWLSSLVYKENGEKYSFIDFSKEKYGRLFAFYLRKYFKYYIIQSKIATREQLAFVAVRALLLKTVKKEGIPFTLPYEDKAYSFDNVLSLATRSEWKDLFLFNPSGTEIVSLLGDSFLSHICRWLSTRDEATILEAYEVLPSAHKKHIGLQTEDDLRVFLYDKKDPIYAFASPCKQKLLDFINTKKD